MSAIWLENYLKLMLLHATDNIMIYICKMHRWESVRLLLELIFIFIKQLYMKLHSGIYRYQVIPEQCVL